MRLALIATGDIAIPTFRHLIGHGPILCVLILFFMVFSLSCKKSPEHHDDTSLEIEEYTPFQKQAIVYADTYISGDPEKALQAMLDDIQHTMNASEADVTPLWKNQFLAFSKTRVSMILKHLNRKEEAQQYLQEALAHINQWLKESGRDPIEEQKLISSVIAADHSDTALPWHPKDP